MILKYNILPCVLFDNGHSPLYLLRIFLMMSFNLIVSPNYLFLQEIDGDKMGAFNTNE